MKRFYKKAESGSVEAGFTVLLDGRPIKTPAKAELVLQDEKLAREIAREWDAQKETIEPASMPYMQYAATAIDRVTTQRDVVIEEIAGYGATDLVCYRASYPDKLVKRQSEAWDPLLDWLKTHHNLSLKTTTGIAHIQQDETVLSAMQAVIESKTDLQLAAIHTIVSLTGSLVVTLAIIAGHLDAEKAYDVSELDETFVIEEWGEDAESATRRKNNKESLVAAIKFLNLCDQ